jgi:hypothetical protein
VRRSTRSGLLAAIAVAILALSAADASVSVTSMGIVVQANNATLNGSPVANRAAIFDGNTLATDNAGALRAQFGSSQIYLFSNSKVTVSHAANGFVADLAGGSVLLSSGAGETYSVLSDGAIVQPKAAAQSVAQISRVSPTELILTSHRGDVQVTMGEETQTVSEGSSYRMMIASASRPASSSRTNNFCLIALLITASGTAAAVAVALEYESPSAPY